MTVLEVIGTGFDGVFVSKGKGGVGIGTGFETPEGVLSEDIINWRIGRCEEMLRRLGPGAWKAAWKEIRSEEYPEISVEEYKKRPFASLSTGEQRVVLLMRALVGRPPLVILDEVWSGMDEGMINTVRGYLRSEHAFGDHQAVVVITHWVDEVPWSLEEGLQQYTLKI